MPCRRSTGQLAPGPGEGRGARRSADEQHTASLVQTFRDRVAAAENHEALTAALAQGLAGLGASLEDGALMVEFKLVDIPDTEQERKRRIALVDRAETVVRPCGSPPQSPTLERGADPAAGDRDRDVDEVNRER